MVQISESESVPDPYYNDMDPEHCLSDQCALHGKEIWINVFPEKELRGLSPNFHIHVSVSDLYIPRFGPPIFLQQNMQTDQMNI